MYTKVRAVPVIEKQAVCIEVQRGLFQQTEHLHNTTDHVDSATQDTGCEESHIQGRLTSSGSVVPNWFGLELVPH